MEATKGLCMRGLKGATKDCFLFYSWFYFKETAEAAMDVGVDRVGMVKTNTKGFCKETIGNPKKDWPGGSHLVLKRKSTVTGDRPLIAIR